MISSYQLLCVLLLSRIAAELTFPVAGGYDATTLAAAALAEVIRFAAALPVLLYSIKGSSFYAAIARKSRIGGWIIGLAVALMVAVFAVNSAIFTAEFAQRTVLSGMSGAVSALLITAFAIYAAVKGAEAIARSSVLILAGAAVITLISVVAATPHMRELTISPEIGTDFFSQVYGRLSRGSEYLIFSALLPHIRREKNALSPAGSVVAFCGISMACVLLIQLFGMAVLGEFYALAEYPFTAAAQLSDIALFKRLDGFTAAVWAAAGAMRCAVYLYAEYAIIAAVRNTVKGDSHEADTHRRNTGGNAAA